jgi:hypothetical protein
MGEGIRRDVEKALHMEQQVDTKWELNESRRWWKRRSRTCTARDKGLAHLRRGGRERVCDVSRSTRSDRPNGSAGKKSAVGGGESHAPPQNGVCAIKRKLIELPRIEQSRE